MKTNKVKIWTGCSIMFSIAIKKNENPEKLIAFGNYTKITEGARKIINTLGPEESEEEQIMDVELVEFEEHPSEDDVQKEFKKRGLLFPEDLDALRFGAKYHEMGTLLNNVSKCCVMFPHEISPHARTSRPILAISYDNDERTLEEGGFGTQWFERWHFAGLKPRTKE